MTRRTAALDGVETKPITLDPAVDLASFAASLWRQVTKTETCWLWTGAKKGRGYGHIGLRGRWIATHRLSFELAYGPIPAGLRVCHRCDVPACVRPDHLFLGTAKDNSKDMIAKGRVGDVGAKGQRNGKAKVSDAQVLKIRERAAAGESRTALCNEFGLTKASVGKIIRGETWRHLLPVIPQRADALYAKFSDPDVRAEA